MRQRNGEALKANVGSTVDPQSRATISEGERRLQLLCHRDGDCLLVRSRVTGQAYRLDERIISTSTSKQSDGVLTFGSPEWDVDRGNNEDRLLPRGVRIGEDHARS